MRPAENCVARESAYSCIGLLCHARQICLGERDYPIMQLYRTGIILLAAAPSCTAGNGTEKRMVLQPSTYLTPFDGQTYLFSTITHSRKYGCFDDLQAVRIARGVRPYMFLRAVGIRW